MRQCPFDGCEQRVSDLLFACKQHWYSLPKKLQVRVWCLFRAYTTNKIVIDQLRASQQAVLDEAQGRK